MLHGCVAHAKDEARWQSSCGLWAMDLRAMRGRVHLKWTTDVLQQHQGARSDMAIDVELMIALKRFDCR